MLDRNLFIEERGNDHQLIRESQRRHFSDVDLVDKVFEFDRDWRHRKFEHDNLRKGLNAVTRQVQELKEAREYATEAMQWIAAIKVSIKEKSTKLQEATERLYSTLGKIGNLVHDSVPISNKEDDNLVERT